MDTIASRHAHTVARLTACVVVFVIAAAIYASV